MPNLKDLPPEMRIKRYHAEVHRYLDKPGRTNELMLKIYRGLLQVAEDEIHTLTARANHSGSVASSRHIRLKFK